MDPRKTTNTEIEGGYTVYRSTSIYPGSKEEMISNGCRRNWNNDPSKFQELSECVYCLIQRFYRLNKERHTFK